MQRRILWATALAALLTTGGASGHGAPIILDVEVHLLHDAGSDASALYDGYDVTDVHGREARLPDGSEGIILRINLYGGFGPAPVADELSIMVGMTGDPDAGQHAFTLRTTNGVDWEGDARIHELSVEPDGFAGTNVILQVFVPYEDLGVAPGQSVTDFWIESRAGDAVVDLAPGGWALPLPGAPILDEESKIMLAAWTLQGPLGYTTTTATTAGRSLRLDIDNGISVVGQHLIVSWEGAGWTLEADSEPTVAVEAGADLVLHLNATATGNGPLAVHVDSDLGGRETLWFVDDDGLRPGRLAAGDDLAAESPSLPVWTLLATVGLAVAWRRR